MFGLVNKSIVAATFSLVLISPVATAGPLPVAGAQNISAAEPQLNVDFARDIRTLYERRRYRQALQLADSRINEFMAKGANMRVGSGDWRKDIRSYAIVYSLLTEEERRHIYLSELFNLKGLALLMLDDKEASMGCFRAAAQENPFSSLAYANMGTAQAKLGNLEEALKHYEKALSLNPRAWDVYRNRAEIRRRERQIDLADKDAEMAQTLRRKNEQDEVSAGDLTKCLFAEKVIGKLPRSEKTLAAQAQIEWEKLKLAQSERNFEESIKLSSKYAPAHGAYGMLLLWEKKYVRAVKELSAAIALESNYPAAVFNRARANILGGNPAAAMIDYDHFLAMKSGMLDLERRVWAGKGDAHLCLKNPRMAISCYERAASMGATGGEQAVYLAARGEVLYRLGFIEEATKSLDLAIAADPNNKDAMARRAKAMVSQGHYEQAIADFGTSRGTTAGDSPQAPPTEKEIAALIQQYDQLIVMFPGSKDGLYNRGILHLTRGDAGRAAGDFISVINLNKQATTSSDCAFCFALVSLKFENKLKEAEALKKRYRLLKRSDKATQEVEYFLYDRGKPQISIADARYPLTYRTRALSLFGLDSYCKGDKLSAKEYLMAVKNGGEQTMDEYVLAQVYLRKLQTGK